MFTVTYENGKFLIWAPDSSFPLAELDTVDADLLARELLAALAIHRWTQ